MKLAIGTLGMERFARDDVAQIVDLVATAERAGIDEAVVTDHVVMGGDPGAYPYGAFRGRPGDPWFEPVTLLAALAGATTRIRLATAILIAPLRPAVLLAKQLATLDVLSRGRLDIGLGTGWQKEEYAAANVPWERRHALLEETVRVCKALWAGAPANHDGATVKFTNLYSLPLPHQRTGIPVWFGLAPTDRNLAIIAGLGDGWLPMGADPEAIRTGIARIHHALAAANRAPGDFTVRVVLDPARDDGGRPDLAATLRTIPALAAAGATLIELRPAAFSRTVAEYEDVLGKFVAARP